MTAKSASAPSMRLELRGGVHARPQPYLLQVSFLWRVADHVAADFSRSGVPAQLHRAVGGVSDAQVSSRRHGH